MENSRIEYLTKEVETKIIKSLEDRLIKSCTDYNDKAINFKFEYDIVNNYIFCLMICDTQSECFPKMYRMLTVYAYSTYKDIYFDGNVAGGYTLEDVKKKTLAYVNMIQRDIQSCIS